MLDVVFKDGLAILPTGPAAVDVGVEGGRIASIQPGGGLVGRQTVDAKDHVLLPGGVDPHVHIGTRFGAWTTLDNFHSGTVGAAFGGTTTIIEFAIPEPDQTAATAIDQRLERARDQALVDYGFHACVTGHRFEESVEDLGRLADRGIGSVKIFTTYRDSVGLSMDQIGLVLARAASTRLQVLVHAETNELIQQGIAGQVAAGSLEPVGHLRSRSSTAEADAIGKVGELGSVSGVRLYFVHVSSADGVAAVADLKRRGRGVLAETCIQYLLLDESVYSRPDGELWICSPPIRSLADQAALWDGLVAGVLDVVSTDHNCFDSKQKALHKGDFRRVPNGLPGVELRTPVLLEAVLNGRLSWTGFARLTAEAPARIFGLWPRKGAIAVGADADLVLVDPAGETDLSQTHMATDYSPFKAMTGRGAVRQTWVRGTCVMAGGQIRSTPGYGKFVATYALPTHPLSNMELAD